MRGLPHVHFPTLSGPPETTIVSSYYTLPRCPADEREPIPIGAACGGEGLLVLGEPLDRKSTRLNSRPGYISYAVFCLKKKKTAAPRPGDGSSSKHSYRHPPHDPRPRARR